MNCSICSELDGRSGSRLALALDDPGIRNAVRTVTERLAVIPSVGPLSVGHSLIVTRHHRTNLLADATCQEIDDICNVARDLYRTGFVAAANSDALLCFEHGTGANGCDKRCGTTHAHLHVIPLAFESIAKVLKCVTERHEFGDSTTERLAEARNLDYIVVFCIGRNLEWRNLSIAIGGAYPSQLMRRIVAESIGVADWDWKKSKRREVLTSTLGLGFDANLSLRQRPATKSVAWV